MRLPQQAPWLVVFAAASLGGCASPPWVSSPTFGDVRFIGRPQVELTDVPFHPADDHQCGPAALATMLSQAGAPTDPADLTRDIYLPDRVGTLTIELTAAARRHGRLPERLPPTLDALTTALAQGHAVLVLQNLGLDWLPRWHYAVVIGVDSLHDAVLLRSGTERRQVLPTYTFEHTWSRSGRFALVLLRPEQPPLFSPAAGWLRQLADSHAGVVAWQTATRQWPQSAAAWFGLGNALRSQQPPDPAAAEQAVHRALQEDPAFLPATNNLAMLLAARGAGAAALQLLDQALADHGSDPASALLQATRSELRALPATNGASNALR